VPSTTKSLVDGTDVGGADAVLDAGPPAVAQLQPGVLLAGVVGGNAGQPQRVAAQVPGAVRVFHVTQVGQVGQARLVHPNSTPPGAAEAGDIET